MWVEFLCTACGERHAMGGFRPQPGDPTEAGSLAELYPDGRVPWSVASVLNAKLWCPKVKVYVPLEDPARVFVGPLVGWGEV